MYATELKPMFFMSNTLFGLAPEQNGAEFCPNERTNMKHFNPKNAPNTLSGACHRNTVTDSVHSEYIHA